MIDIFVICGVVFGIILMIIYCLATAFLDVKFIPFNIIMLYASACGSTAGIRLISLVFSNSASKEMQEHWFVISVGAICTIVMAGIGIYSSFKMNRKI